MTNSRIRPWRRLAEAAQALLVLGIPFLRIRGESALRFDIPTLRLHLFGTTLWMDEFFIVLVLLIAVTFMIIFITQLFGRLWCGWLCPQTVISDLTSYIVSSTGSMLRRAFAYLLTLVVSVVVAADLIWYFVSPYDFVPKLLSYSLGTTVWGFWIALTLIIFVNYAFVRHTWCATVCPYAKLQGVVFDDRTMRIAFDGRRRDECMDCRACVRVCPVHIDIRNGLSAACISCAECMDTCADRMSRKDRQGLIGYFFGQPGSEGPVIRGNVVIIGILALLSLALFLYLSLSRNPLDLTVLPDNDFTPRLSARQEFMERVVLAVENRGRTDLDVSVTAGAAGMPIRTVPNSFRIPAGDYRRIPITLFVPAAVNVQQTPVAEIVLKTSDEATVRGTTYLRRTGAQ